MGHKSTVPPSLICERGRRPLHVLKLHETSLEQPDSAGFDTQSLHCRCKRRGKPPCWRRKPQSDRPPIFRKPSTVSSHTAVLWHACVLLDMACQAGSTAASHASTATAFDQDCTHCAAIDVPPGRSAICRRPVLARPGAQILCLSCIRLLLAPGALSVLDVTLCELCLQG